MDRLQDRVKARQCRWVLREEDERAKRRKFLKSVLFSAAGLTSLRLANSVTALAAAGFSGRAEAARTQPRFHLGLVTYNLAANWDVETIIKNCEATDFQGVELRTTHKHGVEPMIAKSRRAEVKKHFADSRVRLVSLGTTCEYQSPDTAVVEKNIEETRRWCELAEDLGCLGVKVRPNGLLV